jgi:hypothetical protein
VDIVLSRAPLREKPLELHEVPVLKPPRGSCCLQARKKAVVANGPKFREETPKKGSNTATPIAVLHCNN